MTLTLYKQDTDLTGLDLIANKYVAFNGLKRQRSDVDAPNSGRALDGTMMRKRVATKHRLDVTTVPLTTSQINGIGDYIKQEKFWVTYSDPELGTRTKVQMYSNNYTVEYVIQKLDNSTTPPTKVDYWKMTFPLIEF